VRVLLDENLPHDLILELVGHEVVTVQGTRPHRSLIRRRRDSGSFEQGTALARDEPPADVNLEQLDTLDDPLNKRK
jgi:hypothetical protein